MRRCYKCRQQLPDEKFYKDLHASKGYQFICKDCTKIKNSEYNSKNREKRKLSYRNSDLKRKYGISISEYEIILAGQNGKCKICGSTESNGRGVFYVDHSHATGKIRGLLCNPCNIALGMFRDSIDTLKSAIAYLEYNSSTSARDALKGVKIYAELVGDDKKCG